VDINRDLPNKIYEDCRTTARKQRSVTTEWDYFTLLVPLRELTIQPQYGILRGKNTDFKEIFQSRRKWQLKTDYYWQIRLPEELALSAASACAYITSSSTITILFYRKKLDNYFVDEWPYINDCVRLTCIRKVPGLNLGLGHDFPHPSKICRDSNVGKVITTQCSAHLTPRHLFSHSITVKRTSKHEP
jgi:hypothetical protein